MKDILLFNIILSIYKSCDWIYFFHGTVIEIVFNIEVQIFFFSNQFIFLRGKKKCLHYWKNFKFKL
jgi:hypothetical protein